MDKETLSQYGWVVIVIIVLAIMIGLASPFGNYISASVDNTAKGFGNNISNSLNVDAYSDAIIEMKPQAFVLNSAFKEYATEAVTPNYLYAKQTGAKTIEDAIEMKDGYIYEGDPDKYGYYGTGSVIRVYKDGELFGTYHLVVLGDINGDSVVDVLDVANVSLLINGHTTATGAEFAAVDFNKNGIIEDKNHETKEDYEIVSEIAMGDEPAYLKYYNKLIGFSYEPLEAVSDITFSKWESTKDVTKVVFEKNSLLDFTIESFATDVAPNNNSAYDLSEIGVISRSGVDRINLAFYLTTEGEDKVLHIATNESVILAPASLSGLFSGLTNLKSVDFNGMLDTRYVTDFSKMFQNCSSLTSVNLKGLDFSAATNLNFMFSGCSSLKEIKNFSAINAAHPTTVKRMFYSCAALTSLDLSGLDLSNATDMTQIFSGCEGLRNIKINFNIPLITTANGLFQNCAALTSVEFVDVNTSNVTNMAGMFSGCTNLSSVDLTDFDTSKVTVFSQMFKGCASLTTLDLSSFDFSNATTVASLCNGCTAMKHVYVNETWDNLTISTATAFLNCGVSAPEHK
jgi:surface protein